MTARFPADKPEKLRALLVGLRDSPTKLDAYVVRDVLAWVLAQPPSAREHWYCHRASDLLRMASVYLLSLFSFDKKEKWTVHLAKVLSGCCDCVRGLQEGKRESPTTYLGYYSAPEVKGFMDVVDEWEAQYIMNSLEVAPSSDGLAPATLPDVPVSVLYHLVMNLKVLRNPAVLSLLQQHAPILSQRTLAGWRLSEQKPPPPPPPGLFYLLLHQDSHIRSFASKHLPSSSAAIPDEAFVGPYVEVAEMLGHVIATLNSRNDIMVLDEHSRDAGFLFSTDPMCIWAGVKVGLQYMPSKYLRFGSVDLTHALVGRLRDDGPEFEAILNCFMYTIKRLGSQLWSDRSDDYPQHVVAALSENQFFLRLLESPDLGDKLPSHLVWLLEFTFSIWKLPSFEKTLAGIVDLLCGRLPNEQSHDTGPLALGAAAKILTSILNRSETPQASLLPQQRAALNALHAHPQRFISAAFSRETADLQWSFVRRSARDLIRQAMLSDVYSVLRSVDELSKAAKALEKTKKAPAFPHPPPAVNADFWEKVYAGLQPNDFDGITLILQVLAPVSHVDTLMDSPYRPLFTANADGAARRAYKRINDALKAFRGGVLGVVTSFVKHSGASAAELFQSPGVVQSVIACMFCPAEEVRTAGEALVGQAYDVDLRRECFQALIQRFPEPAISGIFAVIKAFNAYLPSTMEACMLSSSLVKCLADVLDVLVDQPDGLLYDPVFLAGANGFKPAREMLGLWTLMSKALSAIFEYTPQWAGYIDDSQWMVDWMRDAVILGENMVDKWRRLEEAVVTSTQDGGAASSDGGRSLSRDGRSLLEDMESILPNLARWLRLTEPVLLAKTFDLLQSVLGVFDATGASVKREALTRIVRDLKRWREKKNTVRLDPGQVQALIDTVEPFLDDGAFADEEIEILAAPPLPTKQSTLNFGGRVMTTNGPMSGEQLRSGGLKPTGRAQRSIKDYASGSSSSSSSKLGPSTKSFAAPSKPKASGSGASSRSASVTKSEHMKAAHAEAQKRKAATEFAARDEKKLLASAAPAPKPFQPSRSVSRASSEASGPSDNDTGTAGASSSDSDSDGGGLKELKSLHKTKHKRPRQAEPERRTMMLGMDNLPGMRRFGRQLAGGARDEAKRKRARIRPDVSDLHRAILSWAYEHDGPVPPGEPLAAQHVRDAYATYWDFRRTFEPLLLLECWAQLVAGRAERQDAYELQITSRQHVDRWLDLDVFIEESLAPGWSLNETDVVLLRNPASGKTILAKCNSYRTVRGNKVGVHATLRCYLAGRADPGIAPNSKWKVSKAFSLATVHREYGALVSLEFYDHCPFILSPKLPMPSRVEESEVASTMRKYNLNDPQARAILSALRSDGFSLIQGPPGTGKTSTICSLVQAFLASRTGASSVITAGRTAAAPEKTAVKKVLICAPSNAAIDEVASRIRDRGLATNTPIKIVRIGAEKALNISTKDLALDALVDERMGGSGAAMKDNDEYGRVAAALQAVKTAILEKENEASVVTDNISHVQAIEKDRDALLGKRRDLSKQLNLIRDKNQNEARTLDSRRRDARAAVLAEADVICATLSGAGHDNLENLEFEMIIIDEAAQAIELSTLIPLKFDCKHVVMVGDPQQLPPTVISKEATRFLYNQSLFVRLQKQRPEAVHLLSIQYRMHPEISVLPSTLFYQGRLQDGPDMAERTKRAWQDNPRFGIYRFFNIVGSQETSVGFSATNPMEVQTAVHLYRRLTREFASVDFTSRVGFISPYREQVKALRTAFRKNFGEQIAGAIDFNTVDGFQGQEKEIIILSCVRAGPGLESIGFLRDVRRLNVAITRAKSSLFILGHAPTLERSDENWRHMVQDARSRAVLTDIDGTYFTAAGAPPVARSRHVPPAVPALPPKRAAPAPAPAPAPALMTPSEMRTLSAANTIPGLIYTPLTESAPSSSTPTPSEAVPSKKRPLPAEDSTAAPAVQASAATAAQPPPAKRPKGAKDKKKSLFIPKKK